MVQSVELLVDPGIDEWIWRQWRALEAAGLPNQVRHGSLTNWPHVTIGVAEAIPAALDPQLSAIAHEALPMHAHAGGVLWFPGKRHVVARAIVPSEPLLALHSLVSSAMSSLAGLADHLRSGAWTPHITLARGVRTEQLPAIMAAIAAVDELPQHIEGTFTPCRRWDSERRVTWEL